MEVINLLSWMVWSSRVRDQMTFLLCAFDIEYFRSNEMSYLRTRIVNAFFSLMILKAKRQAVSFGANDRKNKLIPLCRDFSEYLFFARFRLSSLLLLSSLCDMFVSLSCSKSCCDCEDLLCRFLPNKCSLHEILSRMKSLMMTEIPLCFRLSFLVFSIVFPFTSSLLQLLLCVCECNWLEIGHGYTKTNREWLSVSLMIRAYEVKVCVDVFPE